MDIYDRGRDGIAPLLHLVVESFIDQDHGKQSDGKQEQWRSMRHLDYVSDPVMGRHLICGEVDLAHHVFEHLAV